LSPRSSSYHRHPKAFLALPGDDLVCGAALHLAAGGGGAEGAGDGKPGGEVDGAGLESQEEEGGVIPQGVKAISKLRWGKSLSTWAVAPDHFTSQGAHLVLLPTEKLVPVRILREEHYQKLVAMAKRKL
jgi:hypothetical protein